MPDTIIPVAGVATTEQVNATIDARFAALADVAMTGDSDDLTEGSVNLLLTVSERAKISELDGEVTTLQEEIVDLKNGLGAGGGGGVTRPGEFPQAFVTGSIGAGDGLTAIEGAAGFTFPTIAGLGKVALITDEPGVVVRRQAFPVQPGRVYRAHGYVNRRVDTANPAGLTVEMRLRLLDADEASLGTVLIGTRNLVAADLTWHFSGTFAVSPVAIAGVDHALDPALLVSVREYVQIYDGDHQTAVLQIEIVDITEAALIEGGLDVVALGGAVATSLAAATAAGASQTAAALSAVATAADRVQTGLDVIAAEAAANTAIGGANIYTSTAAGLAAVSEGGQFSVVVGEEIVRYEDVGGVATERGRLPTAAALRSALAVHCDTIRHGVRGTPVTAAASAAQTHVFAEAIANDGWLSGITLFATTGGTVIVRRFTMAAGVFTQVGSNISLTVVSGLNTFVGGTHFTYTRVNAGEFIGQYGSGVLAVGTVSEDGGGVYIGTGNVTSFTDVDVFRTRNPQIGYDFHVPKITRLERHVARIGTPDGEAPAWVSDPTAIDVDLRRGLVWVPSKRQVRPLTEWITFLTSAGYVRNEMDQLVLISAGEARVSPNGLRIDSQETTNIFVNPLAPATQAVTFTGSATLQVWGDGEISWPLNNGRTGLVRPGYSAAIAAADVTMPLTLTVVGTPQAVMLEKPQIDGSGNSMFTSGGPRPGDLLRMTAEMMAAVNATAATVLVETDAVTTNAQRTLGGASGISLAHRTAAAQATTTNGTNTLAVTGSGDWSRPSRVAVAHDGSGRSIAFNGTAASDANTRGVLDLLGRSGVLSDTNRGASMLMRRIKIWPERKSATTIAALTALAGDLVLSEIAYPSSIDAGTYPALGARICYDPAALNRDILVVMHGFSQSAGDFVDETLTRFARRGFFVIVPDMRGGRNSALSDASGREIMDIVDAVAYVRDRFAPLVSADRAHLVGYSGGGGNTLAAAMKTPDSFLGFVDHFGMSDYGYDATYGWYYTNTSFQADITTRLGGTPGAVPNAYRSRYAIEGVPVNLQGGHLLMFQDADDTSVAASHSTRMRDAMIAGANARYSYYETDESAIFPVTSAYTHGLPGAGGNAISEGIWIPRLARIEPWIVPVSGTMRVHGFLRTKRFSIFLGDGKSGVATLVYNTTAGTYAVTVVSGGPLSVTVTQGARTASGTVTTSSTLTVA